MRHDSWTIQFIQLAQEIKSFKNVIKINFWDNLFLRSFDEIVILANRNKRFADLKNCLIFIIIFVSSLPA